MIQEIDIVTLLEAITNDAGVTANRGESVTVVSVHGGGVAFDLERVHEDGSGDLFYSVEAHKVALSRTFL
jgi:hypothetical protein